MNRRVMIIGAGTIGAAHAKAAALTAGIDVAAIVDPNGDNAAALAESHPGCRVETDALSAVRSSDIDAVVVATPNRWHGEYAVAAMESGKDVLVEKPMGLSADECRRMNRVAEATDRILQVGMTNRWTGVGQAAKRVINQGALGEIYHAKAHLYNRRSVPGLGGWFTTKSIAGGGVLVDTGVHVVDLALWLMGFPRTTAVGGKVYSHFGRRMGDYVYESMWAGPPRLDGVCDVEDSAHALVRFESGATLDVQVSWAMNIPEGMQSNFMGLFGDRGGLTFELFGDHLDLAVERDRKNVDDRIPVHETDQFQAQMAGFADSVATRRPPLATGAQGEAVQSILDAVYESSEQNREVSLQPS